jgi:hypothetical protein
MKMIDVTEKTWKLNAISSLQDIFLFFCKKIFCRKVLIPAKHGDYKEYPSSEY